MTYNKTHKAGVGPGYLSYFIGPARVIISILGLLMLCFIMPVWAQNPTLSQSDRIDGEDTGQGQAISMAEFCDSAIKYQPSGDVEFSPGVDVRGNQVKEPDLNNFDGDELFDVFVIQLRVEDLDALNVPQDSLLSPETLLGMAIVSDDQIKIGDQVIGRDNITAACRQANATDPMDEDDQDAASSNMNGMGK